MPQQIKTERKLHRNIAIHKKALLCGLPSFVNFFSRKKRSIKEKRKREINQVQEIKDGIFVPLIRAMRMKSLLKILVAFSIVARDSLSSFLSLLWILLLKSSLFFLLVINVYTIISTIVPKAWAFLWATFCLFIDSRIKSLLSSFLSWNV